MASHYFSKLKDFDSKVCNSCGKCCFPAVPMPGNKYACTPGFACAYLAPTSDGATRCQVYSKRFLKAPWCMSVAEAYDQGKLPNDCPYVAEDPDYQGIDFMSEDTEKVILPHVFNLLATLPVKPWVKYKEKE